MVQGHILKFLQRQQPNTRNSRKLFPQQKIGQSKQSPDWFKRKFSLQQSQGYQYKYDQPHIRSKFKNQSQRNQFHVSKQDINRFIQQNNKKETIHNRKKGLLSEYLDKNAWMKTAIPISGFQRNQQSRRLNNLDRQKNIQTIQFKKSAYIAAKTASNFYTSRNSQLSSKIQNRQIKTSQSPYINQFQENNPQNHMNVTGKSIQQISNLRSKSIPILMGQKQKIRSQRLKLVMNKIHNIQKMKLDETMTSRKMRTIDSQFVQQRMAMTAREWGGKKISPTKSIQRFEEMMGWNQRLDKKNYRTLFAKKLSMPIQPQNTIQLFEQNPFISNQL